MNIKEIYQYRERKFRAKMVGLAPTVRKEYQWAEGAYYKHINRMPCPIGDEVKPEDIDHVIIRSGFADCYHYFKKCTLMIKGMWYRFNNNDKMEGVRVAA